MGVITFNSRSDLEAAIASALASVAGQSLVKLVAKELIAHTADAAPAPTAKKTGAKAAAKPKATKATAAKPAAAKPKAAKTDSPAPKLPANVKPGVHVRIADADSGDWKGVFKAIKPGDPSTAVIKWKDGETYPAPVSAISRDVAYYKAKAAAAAEAST